MFEPKRDDVLVDLLAQAMERLEAGGTAALESFLDEHPEHSGAVRELLQRLRGVGMLTPPVPEIPEHLGEFRLKRRLGGGGMGVVYVAHQPSLRREVALKLIRPENLFFPHARERFRREVEAVARLQHPHIVQVHAVGEEQGLPYFTMERVRGVSLDRLLEALRPRGPAGLDEGVLGAMLERLALEDGEEQKPDLPRTGSSWVELCLRWTRDLAGALEYAHGQGVLHRDVKPSNVMLTWYGRVTLLDFGLASTRGSSRITRSGSALGSVPYMAPEQVRGDLEAVCATTDVYGLGVMLYELLTLRNPYHDLTQDLEETRRRILEGRPAPIKSLNSSVPWDVETVCLTAMDPDPARRYPSAAALARDLTNLLELRPIEARRPGVALRLRRLVQRHPAWSVGVVLGFLLFVVGPSLFALREHRMRERLRREKSIADATLQFLNEDLLAAVAPEKLGHDVSMREVLDVAAARIEGRFPDQPRVEAAVRSTIGNTYRLLGVHGPAETHLLRALELSTTSSGPHAEATLAVERQLVMLYSAQGRYAVGATLGTESLEAHRRTLGADHVDAIRCASALGLLYLRAGRYPEAAPLLSDALERGRKTLGEEDPQTLRVMAHLGILYEYTGRYEEAEKLKRRDLEISLRVLGEEHPDTITSMNNLATLLDRTGGSPEEVEALAARSLELTEKVYGDTHPVTLRATMERAIPLVNRGRTQEAETLLDSLAGRAGSFDDQPPLVICYAWSRAVVKLRQGQLAEAEDLIAPALEMALEHFGEGHDDTTEVMLLYAIILEKRGRREEALDLYEELRAIAEDPSFPMDPMDALGVSVGYASCLGSLGRPEEAEAVLLQAFADTEALLGRSDSRTQEVALRLVQLYDGWKKKASAEHWRALVRDMAAEVTLRSAAAGGPGGAFGLSLPEKNLPAE